MSAEPQFLSFKGLKQYSPEAGWGQVHTLNTATTPPPVPDNVPTLTETPEPELDPTAPGFNESMDALFEKLRASPNDQLTQTWRTIAAEVNLLTQRMALQRELQERLRRIDQDLSDLRSTILHHLQDVEQAANQQLSTARHRADMSALAQSKLAAKLNANR
jgi:hypothetical protein